MIFSLADFSANAAYHLLTQTVIPRPIAWVLTQNNITDSYNLAPFSYFTPVTSEPPLLMLSIATKDSAGAAKDTLVNILREQQFTLHIATAEQMQAVQDSATPLPYGTSELQITKQQLVEFEQTPLKRLDDVPIAFACQLYQQQRIGTQQLIFGEVTHAYIDNQYLQTHDNKIQVNPEQVNPLARLGLGQFCQITGVKRPNIIKST